MTHGVEIRAAEPADIEELIGAYGWLFAPPGSQPPTWDERRAAVALRQAMESHDAAVLVATGEAGRIIGFVTGYLDIHSVRFGYRCWVEDLAVDPELRSRGVGKAAPGGDPRLGARARSHAPGAGLRGHQSGCPPLLRARGRRRRLALVSLGSCLTALDLPLGVACGLARICAALSTSLEGGT